MPTRSNSANEAIYNQPALRTKLKNEIQKSSKGGKAGQWSARKAQMLAKSYEGQGGGYTHSGKKTAAQKNLTQWTKKHQKH